MRREWFERNREGNLAKKRAGNRAYGQTVAGRERSKRSAAKARARHPDRVHARALLSWAVRTGALARPDACSHCGVPCKPEAHHYAGYSEEAALLVQWLCRNCTAADAAARKMLHLFLAVPA